MFRDFYQRALNSPEIIAIVVLVAVVATTLGGSSVAEPDHQIQRQSLSYSHLVTAPRSDDSTRKK